MSAHDGYLVNHISILFNTFAETVGDVLRILLWAQRELPAVLTGFSGHYRETKDLTHRVHNEKVCHSLFWRTEGGFLYSSTSKKGPENCHNCHNEWGTSSVVSMEVGLCAQHSRLQYIYSIEEAISSTADHLICTSKGESLSPNTIMTFDNFLLFLHHWGVHFFSER